MATPVLSSSSFITGEIAPQLFGYPDLARFHSGASTMRNMFPRVTGGAYSRAGTAFVGFSKQTGHAYAPRLVPFQFSVLQGRMLEFGDFYMRVIADGGYVTDIVLQTASATNTNPLTVTMPAQSGADVMVINSDVYSSYSPGEIVTLGGGVYTAPAQIDVITTDLLAITPQPGVGAGYAPGDTVDLAGGVQIAPPQVLIATTQITSIAISAAGTGGTDGTVTIVGTTGTGTAFQAQGLIQGGKLVSILSVTYPGSYTVNPTDLAAEPITGGSLSDAKVAITMGPATITLTDGGAFTGNPSNTLTQAATSGSGLGAVFTTPLMGIATAAISNPGVYTTFPTNPVSQLSSTASGAGAQFDMTWSNSTPVFNIGDWIAFSGVGGMTEINGRTLVVVDVTGDTYTFHDPCGASVDATAWGVYSSGGTGARIYTVVAPYAEADLKWLKFTQSADVMSLCCVNQDTKTEYPPIDLERHSDTDWRFVVVDMEPVINPPGSCSLLPTFNYAYQSLTVGFDKYPNPVTASYAYCVTAVDNDGNESIASPVGQVVGAVDIATYQGSVMVNYPAVPGAKFYNVYKATPVSAWGFYPLPVPVGALFGYAGTSRGQLWNDNNVVADFQQTPPLHRNPFARGQITQVNILSGGNLYQEAAVTINTATGAGAIILAVIQRGGDAGLGLPSPGPIVGFIVQDTGHDYLPTDTVTVAESGGGSGTGATAALVVGPQSGTYPSLPAYYQQRRIYASTLNDPDTYWMSVVGAYKNFDTRIPTIDSDSIEGTPWTQQVNGIQWMVTMPGGIITLTGLGAWLVGGDGSSPLNPQPITPAGQQAQPQVFTGASPTVAPVRIDWDVIYVQAMGGRYGDFTLNNYFVNYYTGSDITINCPHLFLNYNVVQHAWCEEPYKLLWSVRSDGAMLSCTYYKPEKVLGWARHDTYGQFLSVASVIEPPVNALYMAVLRPICANQGCAIVIERMDNRTWTNAEDVWAVDCGLRHPQPKPPAILSISTPDGNGAIVGTVDKQGGQNYGAATFAYIVDDNGLGTGSGAAVDVNVVGGVVNWSISAPGAGYSRPALVFEDPSGQGSGASGTLLLQTQAAFLTNNPTFSPSSVGFVIRAAGGTAVITSYISESEVLGDLIIPASAFMPELNQGTFIPNVPAGQWTLTEPAQVVSIPHLTGQTVTGLADGLLVGPRTVAADGTVTLDLPATAITLGLGFTAQLQSMYVDVGEPTVQGQRKKVGAMVALLDASRGIKVGANQIDGSTLNPIQLAPDWVEMTDVPNLLDRPYVGGPVPLYTGQIRIALNNDVGRHGQVALQQDKPLPMNVLSLVPEVLPGDTPDTNVRPRQQPRQ